MSEEEVTEVQAGSPHARMVAFLAESERVVPQEQPPCEEHDPQTVASWPSGPDGETDSLAMCRRCGFQSIRADGAEDEEGNG